MHDAHITPASADDEAAAVVTALAAYLVSEAQPASVEPERVSAWHQSAKLQAQGLQPVRTARPLRWNTVERLRRTAGFGDVIGW